MTPPIAETGYRLPDALVGWVSRQRWYANKGSEPRLEQIGGWELEIDGVVIRTLYLRARSALGASLYQVPLTERLVPLEGIEPIALVDDRYIYDAPHDAAYAAAICDLILRERGIGGARGHRQPGTPDVEIVASAVLSGEQSNTSIICRVASGPPVIVKVFRALHHGDNPDVVLPSAIAATGSRLVPNSVGFLSGSWADAAQSAGIAHGQLAFAQEFLSDAEDAWRIASRAVREPRNFDGEARELGIATADVHRILSEVLPTRDATAHDVDGVIDSMRARLELALAAVPSLEAYRARILQVFENAREAPWPRLQRIHGDYHLGQVLFVPHRGWVLVDFEGEPLRPMHERSELDVALRDVAGMLRSFDYVAGSVQGGETAMEWASTARHAFVDGYIERSGRDLRQHRALLDAFEIDKALYEADYEARNRPDWIEIPATAIRRLAARSSAPERPVTGA